MLLGWNSENQETLTIIINVPKNSESVSLAKLLFKTSLCLRLFLFCLFSGCIVRLLQGPLFPPIPASSGPYFTHTWKRKFWELLRFQISDEIICLQKHCPNYSLWLTPLLAKLSLPALVTYLNKLEPEIPKWPFYPFFCAWWINHYLYSQGIF